MRAKNQSRLLVVFLIILAIVLEAVIVLWPMACAFSGKGFIAIWKALNEKPVRGIVNIFIWGLIMGLIHGITRGLTEGLATGLFRGLAMSFIVSIGLKVIPGLSLESVSGLIIGGFSLGLFLGFIKALSTEEPSLKPSTMFIDGLSRGIILGLAFGSLKAIKEHSLRFIINGLGMGLLFGLGMGFGLPAGNLLEVYLMRGLRHLPEGFVSTIKGFFKPQYLRTYPFGKAIATFLAAYIGVVIIFSLWFYACYLESPKDHPFFNTGEIENVNWWNFIYFSFVTITTLGYGDISPLRLFPQVLVIAETLIGLMLVMLYLGIILHVASRAASANHTQSVERGRYDTGP